MDEFRALYGKMVIVPFGVKSLKKHDKLLSQQPLVATSPSARGWDLVVAKGKKEEGGDIQQTSALIKQLAQGSNTSEWWSASSNPGSLTAEPAVLSDNDII